MFLKNNNKLFIKIYFSLIVFLTLYYLAVRNSDLTYNAMTEWVINYQGGFVRRGLLGEVVFQISNLFNLNLRFSFLIFQSFLYLIYYYLIYSLIKDLKLNYFILLSIFSPIFIIFPVAELEALGRKEILIFIALVISINLYFRFKNNNLLILFISIIFPILLLTHESSIFYSLFFISLILITKKEIDSFYLFKIILFSIPSLVSVYAIFYYPHLPEETIQMCEELRKVGENCGLATLFLSKNIGFHKSELGWEIDHIFRYVFIFFVGFLGLIYLSFKSKFNDLKINKLFCNHPFIFHLLILILPTFAMFFIAVDTGRWIHMSFTCSFIYYFGLLKNNALVLDNKIFSLNLKSEKLNKTLYALFFFIICLSWNPKAVYHEDLGSLPLYRSLEKFPNYYKSLYEIQIFRQ